MGDGGYACTHYMLTPLTAPQTPSELAYQETQILMRNAVERLFGVWKRRFPVLASGSHINIKTVLSMIVACGVLHNLAIDNHDIGEGFNDVPMDGPENVRQQDISQFKTILEHFSPVFNYHLNHIVSEKSYFIIITFFTFQFLS